MTATSWLVYRLTGSAFPPRRRRLRVPFPVVPPHAVRRHLRRPLEPPPPAGRHAGGVDAQSVRAGRSLTLTGTISIRSIVVSVVQGIVNAFDMPSRQAFVVTLIDNKGDLGNAIALNSSMFNAARLVGPTIAGARHRGRPTKGWCFFIDGVSYVAVIAALLRDADRSPRRGAGPAPTSALAAVHARGGRTPSASAPIRSIILLLGARLPRRRALHRADAGVRGDRVPRRRRTRSAS